MQHRNQLRLALHVFNEATVCVCSLVEIFAILMLMDLNLQFGSKRKMVLVYWQMYYNIANLPNLSTRQ